jgi:hypothetical protein
MFTGNKREKIKLIIIDESFGGAPLRIASKEQTSAIAQNHIPIPALQKNTFNNIFFVLNRNPPFLFWV